MIGWHTFCKMLLQTPAIGAGFFEHWHDTGGWEVKK